MPESNGRNIQYTNDINEADNNSPFYIFNQGDIIHPVILDPFTGLNVGKRSFRIEDVKCAFVEAYDVLVQSSTVSYCVNDNFIDRKSVV